ncbi:MAG: ATP-binding protein [Candidatus Diapherotrites archaeon]|nr:ATP-binding protein [Candidatus Diapherotrites archaeon]
MNIVVASGKGGVGKSMVASSLAILFSREKSVVAVDCDVDAQNLGLWLGVKKMSSGKTISVSESAEIIHEKCSKCGRCAGVCKSGAIEKTAGGFKVNPFLCDGCGACNLVCPENAIEMKKVENAVLQKAKTKFGFEVIGAQLFPGNAGSGKIVAEIREKAGKSKKEVTILDAPAGIGCPVTASIVNTDFAVLVTEPTPSGLSDLKRVLCVANHFKIPFGIIINQRDINKEFSRKIGKFAGKNLLGKISYDKKVVESIVELKPVLENNGKAAGEIKKIFRKIKKELKQIA